MNNPYLHLDSLNDYSEIKPEHLEPAVDLVLKEHEALIDRLLLQENFTYENLALPVIDQDQIFHEIWSLATHLNNVVSNESLREAYNRCLPKITAYYTQLGHNKKLYDAYLSIQKSEAFKHLSPARKKIIHNVLRDFRLSGVALPENQKKDFSELEKKLSKLTNQFEENVLDATDAWNKPVLDLKLLEGLPEDAIEQAKSAAKAKNQPDYLLTLEFPCYNAVLTFAHDRNLREELYRAYSTRASNQSKFLQFDNSEIMEEILKLRHEKANLLGFKNFAELSLATKDANSPDEVMNFMLDLVHKTKPPAQKEYEDIKNYAKKIDHLTQIQAWDIAYYSEKYQHEYFEIADEIIRPYFPAHKVLEGLFKIVEKLYQIKIKEASAQKTFWHKDTQYFEIYNLKGGLIAAFYMDLYARAKKRGGAWMDNYQDKHQFLSGKSQLPVAFLTCNFTPPTASKPALLNHEEVLTTFHEFGHGLHHMLTTIDDAAVSGVNGVAWDVVEFPSQFMENFCWQKETLKMISGHYETHEPLPDALIERLQKLRQFQAAMQMVKQLELSIFDFRIHLDYDPKHLKSIQTVLNETRKEVSVVPVPEFNRFQNSFTHVFGGSYAAGYYSYKWAEVFAADAFEIFIEQGILSPEVGKNFLNKILALGGSREMMDMYIDFCGRKPDVNAMLKHYGLT